MSPATQPQSNRPWVWPMDSIAAHNVIKFSSWHIVTATHAKFGRCMGLPLHYPRPTGSEVIKILCGWTCGEFFFENTIDQNNPTDNSVPENTANQNKSANTPDENSDDPEYSPLINQSFELHPPCSSSPEPEINFIDNLFLLLNQNDTDIRYDTHNV